jgi:hypothetical protein
VPFFLKWRYCGNGYWRRQVDQRNGQRAWMLRLDFYSCLTTPPALILRAFRFAPTIRESYFRV